MAHRCEVATCRAPIAWPATRCERHEATRSHVNAISGPYFSRCSFCDAGGGAFSSAPVAAAFGKVDRDHERGSTMGVVLVCWRCTAKLARIVARGWLKRWRMQRTRVTFPGR